MNSDDQLKSQSKAQHTSIAEQVKSNREHTNAAGNDSQDSRRESLGAPEALWGKERYNPPQSPEGLRSQGFTTQGV